MGDACGEGAGVRYMSDSLLCESVPKKRTKKQFLFFDFVHEARLQKENVG